MYKTIKRGAAKKEKAEKKNSLTQRIMLLVGIGICLTSPIGTQKLIRVLTKKLFNKLSEKDTNISARQLSNALYKLKQRKIIRIEFDKDTNQHRITLTEKGKKIKLEFDAENCKITPPKTWDGKWRMLMFDIPENQKPLRNKLRLKLIQLGFILFQKSIWIYPYPCEKEIKFFTELFEIAPHVTVLTVSIENDQPLRKEFDL